MKNQDWDSYEPYQLYTTRASTLLSPQWALWRLQRGYSGGATFQEVCPILCPTEEQDTARQQQHRLGKTGRRSTMQKNQSWGMASPVAQAP